MERAFIDPSPWVELPLENAPPWWCLPGAGGRIIVRGYDDGPSSSKWNPVPGSRRWSVLTTLVPDAQHAAGTPVGISGPIYPGDCVIFFNSRGEMSPMLPVRVLDIQSADEEWCSVLSLYDGDLEARFVDSDAYYWSVKELSESVLPLRGDDRRRVLNTIQWAIECPNCGAMGRVLFDGPTSTQVAPHAGANTLVLPAASQGYECLVCGSVWAVGASGAISPMGFSHPT